MSNRFDPVAAWSALSIDQQRQIGAAALLLIVSSDANTSDELLGDAGRRWQHAEQEAWLLLSQFAPDVSEYPGGPDLTALNIRACRQCGCTDRSGCPEGCGWAEADLCTSCVVAP